MFSHNRIKNKLISCTTASKRLSRLDAEVCPTHSEPGLVLNRRRGANATVVVMLVVFLVVRRRVVVQTGSLWAMRVESCYYSYPGIQQLHVLRHDMNQRNRRWMNQRNWRRPRWKHGRIRERFLFALNDERKEKIGRAYIGSLRVSWLDFLNFLELSLCPRAIYLQLGPFTYSYYICDLIIFEFIPYIIFWLVHNTRFFNSLLLNITIVCRKSIYATNNWDIELGRQIKYSLKVIFTCFVSR